MVRNAIEAMPRGGTVRISTECCQSQVLLTIRDEGVGIPPDLLEKLGTPFFTTKENGTGLGLAVCYRIVHRHNASLFIESHEGEGTAFKIFFNYAS
jgi:signal transduction histidine kinase